MFDILKNSVTDKKNEDSPKETSIPHDALKNKEKKKVFDDKHLSFPKNILKNPETTTKTQDENHSLVSKKLISIVKKHGVDDREKAKALYQDAVEIIKTLLNKLRDNEDLNLYIDTIDDLLSKVFNQFVLGDAILRNIHEAKDDEYYLPNHIVNVLLLSSFLGIKMGFNKSRMRILGLSCVFYDIGMDSFRELIKCPGPLDDEKYTLVKEHVVYGLKLAKRVDKVNDSVKEAIATHHERIDGSGYPKGFRPAKISPYAKIIGLVDTYEAMIHNRPHRPGKNAHQTIKFLLGPIKNSFDYDVMKLFIDKMSIYPIGTIVRLDTGEIARVIEAKSGSPLRPVVMTIRDAEDMPLEERKIIDLSTLKSVSVVESI